MEKPKKLPTVIVNMLLKAIASENEVFYTYRFLTNWAKINGFFIAADYFNKEWPGEMEHSGKLQDYITSWNVLVPLPVIDSPPTNYETLPDVVDTLYKLMYDQYELYEDISKKIFDMDDICTFDFLKFYRKTQREAVAYYADKLALLDGIDLSSKFELLEIEKKLFGS